MNRIVLLLLAAAVLITCSHPKQVTRSSATVTTSGADSSQYEVFIDDPGFDLWYQYNYSPAKDYSNNFYHINNLTAVSNWNEFYREGRYNRVIDSYIEFRPDLDYGIEVNRKLYWYFKYIKSTYRIPIF